MNSTTSGSEPFWRVLIFAVAVPFLSLGARAADPGEVLKRLLVGTKNASGEVVHDVKAKVYSSKLLVVATSDEGGDSELRMYRLPLDPDPRPISIAETIWMVDEILFRNFVGSAENEIVVDYRGARNPVSRIFVWKDAKLIEIAQYPTYWGEWFVDIDHDGTVEIVETACCGHAHCGAAVHIWISLDRFNGERYEAMEDVLAFTTFEMLDGPEQKWQPEFEEPKEGVREYVLDIVNGDRDPSTRVTGSVLLNGVTVVAEDRLNRHRATSSERIRLDPTECHDLTVRIRGPEEGKLYVVVREVGVK